MLRFEHVSFEYDQETVISDVSFHIGQGEFVALLGENGAGKSTLARLCNGLLKPSVGSVLVGGRDTREAKTSALAKEVGFLFQNPDRQLCQETVRAEIMFGLENVLPDDPDERERRLEEMLGLFGLDGGRAPFGLSRGERQTVALASILACRPRLLILDEPTTGLDYRECMTIMDIITAQRENGATVLMISHDMEIVCDFAQRALLLKSGRLIGDVTVRSLMYAPDLLGEASLLPAQIPALAQRMGGAFPDIFSVGDMVSAVKGKVAS
ncbi:MAG: energy-coupling factor ABC transporter ATP-binding protein [Lachnospiraceae bacterium]|jgi:energy-coupling factor transport system ATP-binding protein|nr:energy-coupling factor ABC transporter ATP-binding protein [Lachnospiraceae bacterium]